MSRLRLSRAKHPSLAGHAKIASWLAKQLPYYEFADDATFFGCDGAPEEVVGRRRTAFERMSEECSRRFERSIELTRQSEPSISDLQLTGAYRVPFQFGRRVRDSLRTGSFWSASHGVTLEDLDGNRFYDLAGSYGVNLLGHDVYKGCIERGAARVAELGPVLGGYHPVVADNARRLREISGLDEVSFHMSGTEAVMQAVRLARYHTGRSHLVRFSGAYHGWWEDVQPGPGNPMTVHETYTLSEMSDATLQVLRTRSDIACVLVNPLQALHPNRPAPGDSTLVDGSRSAGFDREAYTRWLRRLREVCDERGIVLIFDEVFVGFRLAPGGAQEYFDVRADLVTYGKTLGGGMPVGVVCGRADLMRRFRQDRPADVCFARGTFNSHPYVMAAMNEFLRLLDSPHTRGLYDGLDARWNARAERLNGLLEAEGLPVRVANISSIWTVLYTQPSRYNWMFQFYLRLEGLALGWVGTGRFIFSLAYTDEDFEAVAERFLHAARAMQRDGFFWAPAGATHRGLKRQVMREMLTRKLGGRALRPLARRD
ncbi:MAG: aminotransferase class III-fold pyridoxal phosphate-dependent enzyme [Myxococcales bacterium]